MAEFAKLRTDLEAVEATIDGQEVVTIKDPITGNFFRLRAPEYWLISQLDGETPYDKVAEKFQNRFKLNINAEAVGQFVQVLEQNFFLENQRSEQATSRKRYLGGGNSLFAKLLFVKLKAFDPSNTLDKLVRLYKPFHSFTGYLIQLLLIVAGILLFAVNSKSFVLNVYDLFTVSSISAIIISFFIMVTIHEYAHALACRLYGGQVTEMGFLLMYFQPCCYCNLSDAWLFPERKKRLVVGWAGLYSGLILFALAVIIWRVTVPSAFINEIARIMTAVIFVTFVFNFNPLIKLDGYYLLSDWLEIPNLRRKAFTYVRELGQKYLLGDSVAGIDYSVRERLIYLIYAVLAVLYTILLVGYLLYLLGAYLYESIGLIGILLLAALLLFTLRQNLLFLGKAFVNYTLSFKSSMKKPIRLTIHLVIWLLVIIVLFFVQIPHRVTGEITIKPIAEFSLQLNSLGMLEKKLVRGGVDAEIKTSYIQMTSLELGSLELIPYVNDGQEATIGDTLAILTSNQVIRELEAERSFLNQLRNDMALLKSPPKKEAVNEAETELQAAQAVYAKAVLDEKRLQDLIKRAGEKSVSQQQLEAADAATKIARADVENKQAKLSLLKSPPKPEEEAVIQSQIQKQQAKLDFLINQQQAQVITTPLSGRVVINHDRDQFLSVIDNAEMEALVPVSDFDIELVWNNQPVEVKVRSYLDKVFTGAVVHVPQDAVNVDEEAKFMISSVIGNESETLQKGMTGFAKIEVGKTSIAGLLLRRLVSMLRVEFWSWW